MEMRRLVWLACLLGLVTAGCSASSKSPSAVPTTTGSTAVAGAVTTTTTTPKFSGSKNSKYCSLARQVSSNVNITATTDLKATFQQFDAVAPQFVSEAPAELKSDANLLVNAFRQIEAAMKAVNYDITKVDPASLQSLQDPKFTASVNRITTYNTEVCGISATSTT
jgi:hypothetical protein